VLQKPEKGVFDGKIVIEYDDFTGRGNQILGSDQER
jgi:hypothetical protein